MDEEFSISKRFDGSEDFKCLIGSCQGLISVRSLRALNNHREKIHSLEPVAKRKRGPNRKPDSRCREKKPGAIKRQSIKRASNIELRLQTCRRMARLRATRRATLGGAVAVEKVCDKINQAMEEYDARASERAKLIGPRVEFCKVHFAEELESSSSNREAEDFEESYPCMSMAHSKEIEDLHIDMSYHCPDSGTSHFLEPARARLNFREDDAIIISKDHTFVYSTIGNDLKGIHSAAFPEPCQPC